MKSKRLLPLVFSLFLFLAGIAISLSLSAVMLWGELEARLINQQIGDESLDLSCPLAIAPWETASIRTTITNTLTDQATKPVVNAFIGQGENARVISETLELAPLESQPLEWTVNGSDIAFERVVLVNIFQRPYRELPSRQDACSILVMSLFELDGKGSLFLLIAMSLVLILGSAGWLLLLLRPLNELTKNIVQLNGLFLGLVLLGLVTSLTRLWGLTIFLDCAALLAVTAGNVEIFLRRR